MRSGELDTIDDCAVNPGDASPMGRCPLEECGCIAYPDRPEDRVKRASELLLAACKRVMTPSVSAGGDEVFDEVRAAIAVAEDPEA